VNFRRILSTFLAILALSASNAVCLVDPNRVEGETGIIEQLGGQLNLDLKFRDEAGKEVTLREVIVPNRPFLLAPVYYTCPNLCNLTLNGVTELLKELKLKLGSDFSVISYSIKPEETPELANKKRVNYQNELGEIDGDKNAWRFLTGDLENVTALSKQIGFKYVREGDDFAHAALVVAVTPAGQLSKYLFGVTYNAEDTRKVLVDASEGRIGTIGEKIFLYCFRYDHLTGKYSPVIMNLTRVVGGITVFILFGTILLLRRAEILRFRDIKFSEGG